MKRKIPKINWEVLSEAEAEVELKRIREVCKEFYNPKPVEFVYVDDTGIDIDRDALMKSYFDAIAKKASARREDWIDSYEYKESVYIEPMTVSMKELQRIESRGSLYREIIKRIQKP